ncbi:MAG TPA: endolytic transglycosylase MltG [Oligoflexus sp.]|uniref:endolytic transglycosylase MltG n=1 Tax=Oligoflexus sp. TaxID=1971216 RepID=UPI002D299828|nr:endolytic transglycosylase MltG [Oligoflexus sp.]HYX32504.1 endolytic transglycosylase MltG [Oligoflexus sp.]
MKRFLLLLFGLGLGFAAGAFWLYQSLPAWSEVARELPQPVVVKLERGTRLVDFAKTLEQENLIDQSSRFRFWIKFYRDYGRFQAGQYRFEGSVSPRQVVETIESGKTWQPVELQYVVPEGFSLNQVIDRLVAHKVASRPELEVMSRDSQLLQKYGIKAPNVEGYLFPATYSLVKMPTSRQVFEKMLDTFFVQLPPGIVEELAARKLTLHQGVIFASLIERETQLDEEREMVSEVIWNRLKDGEPLGIDAALIYGIVDYQGDIKTVHLKDGKNLYNTRIHKGLPPGPIGAISMTSLRAVLNPTRLGYRYYVLGTDGTRQHRFSRTMAEHAVYVKQLIQASQKP